MDSEIKAKAFLEILKKETVFEITNRGVCTMVYVYGWNRVKRTIEVWKAEPADMKSRSLDPCHDPSLAVGFRIVEDERVLENMTLAVERAYVEMVREIFNGWKDSTINHILETDRSCDEMESFIGEKSKRTNEVVELLKSINENLKPCRLG